MRVVLLLWMIVNGQDVAGPGIPMPDLATCQAEAARYMAATHPDEATIVGAGCLVIQPERS